MSDEEKFDNSWQAVWQREINELQERLKSAEHYSARDVEYMQSRVKQLQDAIAKQNEKKDLTAGFANGRKNVKNRAEFNMAQMAQMARDRAA